MTRRPTYEELEKRIQELENIISENALENPSTKNQADQNVSSPPTETGGKETDLAALIDVPAIQSLMNDFNELHPIAMAIIDLKGEVLVQTGWQEICTRFHRVHKASRKNCRESDLVLSNGVTPGTFKRYQCKNHMWDMATPIMAGERKVGNLYLGQFLFEDELVDLETFRLQARKFGFPEDEYLATLESVPRWSRQTIKRVMGFYTRFAQLISDLGYKNLRLNQSEIKYRELVENLNDVVYEIGADGTIVYASPSVESILGYTDKELIDQKWEAFIHEEDLDRISEAFQDVLHHKLRPSEYRVRSKSGEFRWVRTSSRPFYRNGRLIGLQGLLTDITDLKKAEKSLRASEEKFSKAFRNAPLLMTITSLEDGTYLEVNEAFVQVTGFSREAALGKTSTELGVVGGNQRRQLPNLLKQTGCIRDLEIQVTCADGSNRTCLFSGEKIQYEGKERLLSIALDITHRKQNEMEREKLQAQLLQAQKMESVGRLAGGVAHDFNNNLAVIQGHIQLMLETSNDGNPRKENLREVLKAAHRSAGLTRQLLAFARKQTISPKILDLNETVEGMLKMLRRLIGENIELMWHPGPNLSAVKMDPAQIDQILANLCVNARDAIDGSGKLSIETGM